MLPYGFLRANSLIASEELDKMITCLYVLPDLVIPLASAHSFHTYSATDGNNQVYSLLAMFNMEPLGIIGDF
jgi:hypothetical protein